MNINERKELVTNITCVSSDFDLCVLCHFKHDGPECCVTLLAVEHSGDLISVSASCLCDVATRKADV